jgi:hypothetical protein
MSMARREAKCSSDCLRCAPQKEAAGAARDGFVLGSFHGRSANGALGGHLERPVARALLLDARDFGNDVARAAHHHRVALPDVLAADLVLVVQRRVHDRGAAHEDRLQARDGRDGAGAAHLEFDVEQFGGRFLGGEFVRDGPARRARDEAQLLLVGVAVDLVDDAVDVVGKLRAPGAGFRVELEQARHTLHRRALLRDRKAHRLERIEQARVRGRQLEAFHGADAIREEREAALAP